MRQRVRDAARITAARAAKGFWTSVRETVCKANTNRRENDGRGYQFGQVPEAMAGHSNSHQECLIVLEQEGRPRIAWLCRDPRVYTPIEPSFPASSARASRSSIVCLALPDGRLKIRCLNPILRSRLAKSFDGGKPITANSSESKHRPKRSQRARNFPRPSARSFCSPGRPIDIQPSQ